MVDDATTLCTEQVEPIFNTHPDVKRTALVGVGPKGRQVPVLCWEAADPRCDAVEVEAELRHIADGYVQTAKVQHFLLHDAFPVDIRHNAKIGREKLAAWAARELERRA